MTSTVVDNVPLVAASMELDSFHFSWYVKRISGLALVGYFGGIAAYIIQYRLLH